MYDAKTQLQLLGRSDNLIGLCLSCLLGIATNHEETTYPSFSLSDYIGICGKWERSLRNSQDNGGNGLLHNDFAFSCHSKLMRIRARVDLSKRWRFVFLAAYLALLGSSAMEQLSAQLTEPNHWRRTVRGWEYAHSIQANSTPAFAPSNSDEPSAISSIRQWHRIVLPIAISSFIVTFGWWLLIGIPNRGIVRRLS